MANPLKIALVQMAPVLLNKKATVEKMFVKAKEGIEAGAKLIVFSEALLPGYPYWTENTNGAKFNDSIAKEIHAKYIEEAVVPEHGDLEAFQDLAKAHKVAFVVGIIERAMDRSQQSLYCSCVYINQEGSIQNVHRKLMPTYEERLSWSPGDGHGLHTFPLGDFNIGMLNCWENWMPLARTALYAQGENVHISIWPGSKRNVEVLAPFLAQEGRSYSIAVNGIFRKSDIPADFPHRELFVKNAPDVMSDGGTCIANPDGTWLIAPAGTEEIILYAELKIQKVREERQNFDPTGHYSRPDVFELKVNRKRQRGFEFK